MLIRNASFIVTQNPKREIFQGASLRIEGNFIQEIGKLTAKKDEEIIDATDCVVIPGLINAHTHLGMTLLRGYSDDKELHEWLNDIITEEKRQSEKGVYDGARLGCEESLLSGTTTLLDMYTPSEPCAKAASDTGIRVIICPAFFDAFMKISEETLLDFAWQRKYDNHPRVRIGYGPHSIYGCSGPLIQRIFSRAKETKRLMTIHMAETRKERYDCQKQHGKLPLQYLDSLGVLGPNVSLVHSVWLTKEEIRTIGKSGASCIHCPTSNMKLAGGGVLALREMQEAKVNVALGTDSTGSNNRLDMFSEMKMCALLQKHHYWDPTIASAQTVLDMATLHGAKALHMEKETGSLEVGKKADIVIIPITHRMRPAMKERIVSHLVYSVEGSDVDTVIVDGIVKVRNKKLCDNN